MNNTTNQLITLLSNNTHCKIGVAKTLYGYCFYAEGTRAIYSMSNEVIRHMGYMVDNHLIDVISDHESPLSLVWVGSADYDYYREKTITNQQYSCFCDTASSPGTHDIKTCRGCQFYHWCNKDKVKDKVS